MKLVLPCVVVLQILLTTFSTETCRASYYEDILEVSGVAEKDLPTIRESVCYLGNSVCSLASGCRSGGLEICRSWFESFSAFGFNTKNFLVDHYPTAKKYAQDGLVYSAALAKSGGKKLANFGLTVGEILFNMSSQYVWDTSYVLYKTVDYGMGYYNEFRSKASKECSESTSHVVILDLKGRTQIKNLNELKGQFGLGMAGKLACNAISGICYTAKGAFYLGLFEGDRMVHKALWAGPETNEYLANHRSFKSVDDKVREVTNSQIKPFVVRQILNPAHTFGAWQSLMSLFQNLEKIGRSGSGISGDLAALKRLGRGGADLMSTFLFYSNLVMKDLTKGDEELYWTFVSQYATKNLNLSIMEKPSTSQIYEYFWAEIYGFITRTEKDKFGRYGLVHLMEAVEDVHRIISSQTRLVGVAQAGARFMGQRFDLRSEAFAEFIGSLQTLVSEIRPVTEDLDLAAIDDYSMIHIMSVLARHISSDSMKKAGAVLPSLYRWQYESARSFMNDPLNPEKLRREQRYIDAGQAFRIPGYRIPDGINAYNYLFYNEENLKMLGDFLGDVVGKDFHKLIVKVSKMSSLNMIQQTWTRYDKERSGFVINSTRFSATDEPVYKNRVALIRKLQLESMGTSFRDQDFLSETLAETFRLNLDGITCYLHKMMEDLGSKDVTRNRKKELLVKIAVAAFNYCAQDEFGSLSLSDDKTLGFSVTDPVDTTGLRNCKAKKEAVKMRAINLGRKIKTMYSNFRNQRPVTPPLDEVSDLD